jgi:hypothetical protein
MGCNCKKPQIINNLKSIDHLKMAYETFNSNIKDKQIETMDDFDKVIIYNTFKSLYPNAKVLPGIQDAVNKITEAKNLYVQKTTKR